MWFEKKTKNTDPPPPPPPKPKSIKIYSAGKCEGCGSRTFVDERCEYCGGPKIEEDNKYYVPNYCTSGITNVIKSINRSCH